jgi:hypothetical protein
MNWYKVANSYVGYHGSPQEFQEFSYEFMGSTGTAEGFGFYFTSDKSVAEMFADGGMLKKSILEINKPLNFEGRTISEDEFAHFLRTLDPTGEDYLSNWGDVNYEGYEQVVRTAVEGEMSGSDNDVDLISGVIQASGGDAESVYKVLKQALGYDGIIVNNPNWGGNQVVYVVFDNSQIRDV